MSVFYKYIVMKLKDLLVFSLIVIGLHGYQLTSGRNFPADPTALLGTGQVDAEETNLTPYDDPEVTSVNLEPYRATFTPYENAEAATVAAKTTSRTLSLNGLWKFQMVLGKEHVNPDFVQPAFDDHDWADLPVPGNWQRHGFGLPVYSNSTLNTEPDEVGLYRRTFTVPKEWSGGRTILHFAGVKTAYHVYINGKEIGYNEGAFLPGEFDVTENITKGENTLAVTVYRTAAVSDIENFDTWRLSGIFRDVTLLNRPQTYIEDFEVQAPLINDYQDGQWRVRVNVRNKSKRKTPGLKLVASILDDKTGERIHSETLDVPRIDQGDMAQVEVVKILPDIRPWSDEKPNLYTTVLELRDNQKPLEAVSAKTGFRTIEVQGRRLLINGERLIFRGVNRHSWDPDLARVPRPDYLRKELELMKRYNINSVRTSHYPSDPYLYQLADELGIFIMDEAAQETHWKNDRASRDGWLQPHLVRMQGMIERDKNHPSVVMWSTGNEYFSGPNTDSMAIYTAERDPSRPIFEEGRTNRAPEIQPYERYEKEILNTAYEISRPKSLLNFAKADCPVVAKEYMHARGNTLNRFYQLWELMRDPQHENLSGGFIWDWKDQGWRIDAGDARSFLDNGETIGEVWQAHDGSDGVTDSDLNITAKLLEVSKAQQQLEVRAVSGKKNTYEVTNYYKFIPLSDFVTTYVIEHNGEPIHRGSLAGLEAAPGESTEFSIDVNEPDLGGGEYWVTFKFFLKESVSGIPVTHALAWSQLPLKNNEPATVMDESSRPMRIYDDGNHFIMKLDRVRYEISRESGKITSWQIDGKELLQDGNGFEPTIWRAPIAPDVPGWGGNDKRYLLPWKEAGLDQTELVASRVNLAEDGTSLDVELSMQADGETIAVFRQRYTLLENGSLAVGTFFQPGGTVEALTSLPRLGIACELNPNFNQVTWFGKGPQENYINRREGARIGKYSLTAEEMYTDYLEPQSCGNRSLIRWMEITDMSGSGFRASLMSGHELKNRMQFLPAEEAIDQAVAGQWFEFTAIPYSEDELAPASLFSQLPPSSGVSVHLDFEQSGVSQKPWPPRWPEDEVQPVKKAFVFILEPLPRN